MITDPQVIRFVNEQIRPLCEQARALNAKIASMQTDWFSGINAGVPNDNTVLADDRESQGVSRLTGADVNSAVGTFISMSGASNSEIIAKPCVRPLQAE